MIGKGKPQDVRLDARRVDGSDLRTKGYKADSKLVIGVHSSRRREVSISFT